MSKQFTTFKVYPENEQSFKKSRSYSGEVSLTTYSKDVKSCDEGMTSGFLLGVPNTPFSDNETYAKRTVECAINLLRDLFDGGVSKSVVIDTLIKKPNQQMSDSRIPMELQHEVQMIAELLQYIVNSSSWNGKEYHSFDSLEISKRLEHVKNHAEWMFRMSIEEEK